MDAPSSVMGDCLSKCCHVLALIDIPTEASYV